VCGGIFVRWKSVVKGARLTPFTMGRYGVEFVRVFGRFQRGSSASGKTASACSILGLSIFCCTHAIDFAIHVP
jgi:hypothetical protein